VTNTNKTYNGSAQSPTIGSYSASEITVSGTLSATNAGDYTIRFNLTSTSNYVWSDMTTAEKTAAWKIAKVAATLSLPAYTVRLHKTTPVYVRVSKTGDGEIRAYSSNPSIATVTIEGDMLKLVAVSEGVTSVTVSVTEGVNYSAPPSVSIAVTATFYSIMTVEIDLLTMNGDCTYRDDATFLTPGGDAWDEFFGHYPVMLKDGIEGKRLDPNDFTKHEDGTAADITSGSEGDVMICFPRRGLKMTKTREYVRISMTDNPNDPNFEYTAHKRGNTLKDKFYLGAYMSVLANLDSSTSKLWSLSNKMNLDSAKLAAQREYAHRKGAPDGNGGSGYDLSAWFQLIYRQCMYMLKYKNRDSQSTVGQGYVATNLPDQWSGVRTNDKGMDWGDTTTGNEPVKLFGLENFWGGNDWEWVDGIYCDSYNVKTATENFNDTGESYPYADSWGIALDTGYMQQCEGHDRYGFLPVSANGSATTYFYDQVNCYENCVLTYGGKIGSSLAAGVFNFSFVSPTISSVSIGNRLMYL
jgi:hypothetical protein